MSHLYALFPGSAVSPAETPELAAAARTSLEGRGDGGTGWSKAWKINFWARLQDGDHAYRLIESLVRPVRERRVSEGGGLYANLFDGENNIYPVEVQEDQVTHIEFLINYEASY